MPNMTICDTCKRVVNTRTDDTGATYIHTPRDLDDHPVIPVDAPPGYDGGSCDFCTGSGPAFTLPAKDFMHPTMPGQMSRGNWAACLPCAMLINGNEWNALIARVIEAIEQHNQWPLADSQKDDIRRLYEALRVNVSGSLTTLADQAQ